MNILLLLLALLLCSPSLCLLRLCYKKPHTKNYSHIPWNAALLEPNVLFGRIKYNIHRLTQYTKLCEQGKKEADLKDLDFCYKIVEACEKLENQGISRNVIAARIKDYVEEQLIILEENEAEE